jgi:hypothetical protein
VNSKHVVAGIESLIMSYRFDCAHPRADNLANAPGAAVGTFQYEGHLCEG